MPLRTEEVLAKIAWSADVPDRDTVINFVKQMSGLGGVKIDRLFVRRNGEDGDRVFDDLAELGVMMRFNDAKLTEIPSKLEELAREEIKRTHPTMLNCMAGSVSTGILTSENRDEIDGLKRFADVCLNAGVKPCAVTVLTSKTDATVKGEFGGRAPIEQVLWYIEMLIDCGFTDAVCSPEELPILRSVKRFDVLDLNTPGIRRTKSGTQDQARTNTPAGAFKAGASREIIGRDLTTGNPAENLNAIVEEILAAAV